MGAVRTIMYELGQTADSDELDQLLGTEAEFPHVNYALAPQNRVLLSSRRIKAIWMKNGSGGALNPNEVLTPKSGSAHKEVGGVTGSAGTGIGAVDPFVSTVADGKYFWMIVEGPAKARASGSISANAILIPASTGEVTTVTNDAPGSLSACGRAVTAASNANDIIDVVWKFNRV